MVQRTLTTAPETGRAPEAAASDAQCAIVAPVGEIDAHNAAVFRNALLNAHRRVGGLLVVDLSDVSFIDAAALGAIVGVARELGPAAVALVVPHENLAKIFRICGLDRVLSIFASRPEAREPANGLDRPERGAHDERAV